MKFRMSHIFLVVLCVFPLYSADKKYTDFFSLGFTSFDYKASLEAHLASKLDRCVYGRSTTPNGRFMRYCSDGSICSITMPGNDVRPDDSVKVGDKKIVGGNEYECVARVELSDLPGAVRFAPLFFISEHSRKQIKNRNFYCYNSESDSMGILTLDKE